MVQNRAFRFVAVLAPALAVLVGLPLALAPFEASAYGDPRGFFGPYVLLAVPVWKKNLGLAHRRWPARTPSRSAPVA